MPLLNIEYEEKDTGQVWQINCAGIRGYLVRFGFESPVMEDDFDEQAADSHFMIQGITGALLIGGAGLFEAEAVGRLLFKGVQGEIKWSSHLNPPDGILPVVDSSVVESVSDWYRAICRSTMLRRAVHDAYLALSHPHEALVFVYRGLEWLKAGQKLDWEDLARDLGIKEKELKEFWRFVNFETGVRHATASGLKLRADFDNYGTWVCGLLDAINAARARLEDEFNPMTPNEVADAVAKSVPVFPYP